MPTLTCLSSLLAPHFDRRLLRPVFGMPRRRACCLWDAFACRLWMPPLRASFACCAQSRAAFGMMPHSRATLHALSRAVFGTPHSRAGTPRSKASLERTHGRLVHAVLSILLQQRGAGCAASRPAPSSSSTGQSLRPYIEECTRYGTHGLGLRYLHSTHGLLEPVL